MPPKCNTRRNPGKGKSGRAGKQPPSSVPTVSVQEIEAQDSQEEISTDPLKSQDVSDNSKGPANSEEGHQSKEKPKRKKNKKTCSLRNEQEEGELLEWVEENPCLWNLKHRDFKNKVMKNRMWEDKASELGYEVESLKTWYTDLRDWNTKLHSQRSGYGQKEFTDREQWVMNRFTFLRSAVRHRRAPVKSVKEALAVTRGDLEEAERIAVEDKLAIEEVDVERPDDDEHTASSKQKKQKKDVEDSIWRRYGRNLLMPRQS